jgi:hypothetical protein
MALPGVTGVHRLDATTNLTWEHRTVASRMVV